MQWPVVGKEAKVKGAKSCLLQRFGELVDETPVAERIHSFPSPFTSPRLPSAAKLHAE